MNAAVSNPKGPMQWGKLLGETWQSTWTDTPKRLAQAVMGGALLGLAGLASTAERLNLSQIFDTQAALGIAKIVGVVLAVSVSGGILFAFAGPILLAIMLFAVFWFPVLLLDRGRERNQPIMGWYCFAIALFAEIGAMTASFILFNSSEAHP